MLSFLVIQQAAAVPNGKTIEFPGKGAGVVTFNGKSHHGSGIKCSECHPGTFKMRKGSDNITKENHNSRYCGVCHNGQRAFSAGNPSECGKCHHGISDVYALQNYSQQPASPSSPAARPAPAYVQRDSTPPVISEVNVGGNRGISVTPRVSASKVTVSGIASDDSGVAAVYVNGIEAGLTGDGRFRAEPLLKIGQNEIVISAIDIYQNRSEKRMIVVREEGSAAPVAAAVDARPAADAAAAPVSRGRYYALVIGINRYQNVTGLQTAVGDARDVANVLSREFGFQVKTLLDEQATRDHVVHELNNMRKQLSVDDKLLIYYAGHGYFNKETNKAYWLPVDAEENDTTNWIMADDITSQLKLAVAKQVLIVSDSCYSGTLTRSLNVDLSTRGTRMNYINKIMSKSGRMLIASGGNEPVSDSGGRGHSVFEQAFVDGLLNAEGTMFTAEELFVKHIKEPVAGKAEQTPEFRIIQNSGHDGGDFVFIRRQNQ